MNSEKIPKYIWNKGVSLGKKILKTKTLNEVRWRSVKNLCDKHSDDDYLRISVGAFLCGFDYDWIKLPKDGCAHGILDVTETISLKNYKGKRPTHTNCIDLCRVPSGVWLFAFNAHTSNGGHGWRAFCSNWWNGLFATREQCLNYSIEKMIDSYGHSDCKNPEKKHYIKQCNIIKNEIVSTEFYQPELFSITYKKDRNVRLNNEIFFYILFFVKVLDITERLLRLE